MLPLLALFAAPAFAAGPLTPPPAVALPEAPVVRLLVEPVRDAQGAADLSEHWLALQLAVRAAAPGQARVLRGDSVFEEPPGQHVVEVEASAAPQVRQSLEALGARVSPLDALAQSALSTRRALSVGSDADAAAAASALMDRARHPQELSDDLGAVLTGIEAADTRALAPETRRNLARAVYRNTFRLHDALDTLSGDMRITERKGGSAAAARPTASALSDALSRSASALQKLDVDITAPLLTELLTAGDRRVLKDLASDDRRARAYAQSYVAMLRAQVEQTADLAEERFLTDDDARRAQIRVARVQVDPPRTAVWSYDKAAHHYVYVWLRGSAWPLLGVSPAAAEVLSKAFVDLLEDADSLLARAEEALGEGPVDRHVVLDHALQALAPFDPHERSKDPGWSPDRYAASAAALLRDAVTRCGPRAFALAAPVARRFCSDARRSWPLLHGEARDAVEALERALKAKAAAVAR